MSHFFNVHVTQQVRNSRVLYEKTKNPVEVKICKNNVRF